MLRPFLLLLVFVLIVVIGFFQSVQAQTPSTPEEMDLAIQALEAELYGITDEVISSLESEQVSIISSIIDYLKSLLFNIVLEFKEYCSSCCSSTTKTWYGVFP